MSTRTSSHSAFRRAAAVGLACVIAGSAAFIGGTAAYAADGTVGPNGSDRLGALVLTIGADETQRGLTWYSLDDTAQVVQYAPSTQVVGDTFPATAVTVAAAGGPTTNGQFNRKATLSGLDENTVYSYRVGAEGAWSDVQTFRTQSFSGDFDFLFVGDPQIGASGNVARDQAGWTDTLDVAQRTYPDAELLFSAGDQVEKAANEDHYNAFLAPEQLRRLPLVPVNGNHDVGSKAYEQHFNVPNFDASAGAGTATSSGGDYWFMHKGVLFININSNSRDYASHNAFMEKVVAEQGPKATWKVLAFHHSIYSVASHVNDSDIADRRKNMPAEISKLGFDLVLQGHDHSYTRSYLIKDGELADATEVAGQREVVAGAGEVLYVTANSASGSKYYSVKAPNAWYGSVINQEQVRNYSAVEVTGDSITVKTMRSEASGASEVNSVVDQVTLKRKPSEAAQDLQVVVPTQAPGEFAWSIDGTNALVDLGTATESLTGYTASGAINPIAVTDTRVGGPTWAISAQVSDFHAGSREFSGSHLGWTPEVREAGAGASAGERVLGAVDGGAGLAESATLGHAATGHERGTAKLGARLDLTLPLDVKNGTYRATLTLTALS